MRRALITTIAAAALAAGCGTGGGGSDGAADQDAADQNTADQPVAEAAALLDHARCMREAGFDYPDPVIESSGGGVEVTRTDGDDEAVPGFTEADGRCTEEHLADVVRGDDLDPDALADLEARMLEVARCMREEGVAVADPVVVNGAAKFTIGPDDGGDLPSRETLRAAEQQCDMDQLPAVDVEVRG